MPVRNFSFIVLTTLLQSTLESAINILSKIAFSATVLKYLGENVAALTVINTVPYKVI